MQQLCLFQGTQHSFQRLLYELLFIYINFSKRRKYVSTGPKIMKLTPEFKEILKKGVPIWQNRFFGFQRSRDLICIFATRQIAINWFLWGDSWWGRIDTVVTWWSFMLLQLKPQKIEYPLTFRVKKLEAVALIVLSMKSEYKKMNVLESNAKWLFSLWITAWSMNSCSSYTRAFLCCWG